MNAAAYTAISNGPSSAAASRRSSFPSKRPRASRTDAIARSAKSETGRRAESLAQAFLERHGLKLVARNFHCRSGELDLVMLDGDALVVIEVRSRARSSFMSAQESVDWRKQARLIRATEHFRLRQRELRELPVRFDVLAVAGHSDTEVTWIRDAFQAG